MLQISHGSPLLSSRSRQCIILRKYPKPVCHPVSASNALRNEAAADGLNSSPSLLWSPPVCPGFLFPSYPNILLPTCQVKIQDTDGHASFQQGIVFPASHVFRIQFRKTEKLASVPVRIMFYLKLDVDFCTVVHFCQDIQDPLLLFPVSPTKKCIFQAYRTNVFRRNRQNRTDKIPQDCFIPEQLLSYRHPISGE